MKALVCGSRAWRDPAPIEAELRALPAWAEIIHGGAQGADTIAGAVAAQLGMEVRVFPADWNRHGRKAGVLRNIAMLDENPDVVIAFQIAGSRGTQHTIDTALQRGIRVILTRAAPEDTEPL